MLTIPCPKCGKTLYIHYLGTFTPCPKCGFLFSGKLGPDRRSEARIPDKTSFSLILHGRLYKASIFDTSEKGLGIKVLGDASISKGDVLTLPIAKPPINARVMWVKKMAFESLVGLQKITE